MQIMHSFSSRRLFYSDSSRSTSDSENTVISSNTDLSTDTRISLRPRCALKKQAVQETPVRPVENSVNPANYKLADYLTMIVVVFK